MSAATPTRWAVDGIGAVSSVGGSSVELFTSLCEGTTGLTPLRGFDPTLFRATSAYEMDEDRSAPHGRDRPVRATDLLCRAIAEACADAELPAELGAIPVLVGTGLRELRSAELWWTDDAPLRPEQLHFGPALRERFGAVATHTLSNACSASLYALGMATDLLANGDAEVVVVAGVDVITESMFGLLDRVHAEPVDRVRPFDRNRRGVLMGDGASAVVLRREPRAGTRPRAWLRGVGLNCDAFHVTAPDPAGVVAAMQTAHAIAGTTPADIDLVMAHGTGTLLNDEAEATALAKMFGNIPDGPLLTAIKSMTGHTSGASGLMALVVAAQCLDTGTVPATLGLDDPVDEAVGLDFVTGTSATGRSLQLAQIDAFGFGGVNAVAVIEKAS